MSQSEVAEIAALDGSYKVTIWRVKSLLRLRTHYEVTCSCASLRAGTPDGLEVWKMAHNHANSHNARPVSTP